MKKKLIFDHLPKTAGTSIASALCEMFGADGTLPEISNMHLATMAEAGDRRLLAGHLWFLTGEPLWSSWYYCTLLRDPIDRFLSQYEFNRTIARGAVSHVLPGVQMVDPQVQAAGALSLEQYVASTDATIQRSYRNVQAVHFAQRSHEDPHALDDNALLQAALASLDDYDLVGLYADPQGFLDVIAAEFGKARVGLPRLNVTPARGAADAVPAPVRERLRERNAVDLRLYEIARTRFEEARARLHKPRTQQRNDVEFATPAPEVQEPFAFGTREVEIVSVACVGERSGSNLVQAREAVDVVLSCRVNVLVDDLTMGIVVRDRRGQLIYGSNSRLLGLNVRVPSLGPFSKVLRLRPSLGLGQYWVSVSFHRGASHLEGCYHWAQNAASFAVTSQDDPRFEGLVDLGMIAGPSPVRFDAPSGSLQTLVGRRRVDGRIETTGRHGFLIFGPYVPWPAGHYRVTVLGQVQEGNEDAVRFDVVHGKAMQCVGELTLGPASPPSTGPVLARFDFLLPEKVQDLEVRALVSTGSALAIDAVEIEPAMPS